MIARSTGAPGGRGAALGGLAEVGDRPVRAVADVDLVDLAADRLVERDDVPRRVRQRDERRQLVQVDANGAVEVGVRIRALGRPGSVGSALEVLGDRLVGREEAGLGAGLDGHVRDRQALVDRQRLGAVPDELERHVRPPGHADLGDHREDQVLAGDEAAGARP